MAYAITNGLVRIPCVLMRGGTSRGPFFLETDLPPDIAVRDRVLLAAMGSPHRLQVDGIGGANPLTSKVAIISTGTHPDADVDYLFAQVSVERAVVDTGPNCGNMLAAVGPFAIEAGLIPAQNGETSVKVYNRNTKSLIEAIVQTPDGIVTYDGTTRIDGVAGSAAPIKLNFLDAIGGKTGALLPTGAAMESIQGLSATLIDYTMPMMLLLADELGLQGDETPDIPGRKCRAAGARRVGTARSRQVHGPRRCGGSRHTKDRDSLASPPWRHHHVPILRASSVSSRARRDWGVVRGRRVSPAGHRGIQSRRASA
jgi:2-methylaconitate cis-trans-isomerase PrpF